MLLENADFVFLIKAQVIYITRKRVIFTSRFHEVCVEKCWKLMSMFHLLKIRTSIDLFKNERCKSYFWP